MEPQWPFTARMVASAPDLPGVLALWEGKELIYIGCAAKSLRDALLAHLEGKDGCTQRASRYSWQLSLDPARRERELLSEHEARHRALPRCNRNEP